MADAKEITSWLALMRNVMRLIEIINHRYHYYMWKEAPLLTPYQIQPSPADICGDLAARAEVPIVVITQAWGDDSTPYFPINEITNTHRQIIIYQLFNFKL